MSVVAPIVGEVFSFRVLKHHINNPMLKWANVYECRNRTCANLDDLLEVANQIVAFEQVLHHAAVIFEYVTVSTWVPDGEPYNPNSFVSQPMGFAGERTIIGEPLGLAQCFRAQAQVESGRMGHRLFRGVLSESEVTAPSGIEVFDNPSAMNSLISSAVTDNISDLVGTASGRVQLTLESEGSSRRILGFNAAGVTLKKLNNKYFNRTTP